MIHLNDNTSDIDDRIYQCKLCQSSGISFGNFEDHLLTRHNVSMAVVVDNFAFVNSLFMLAPWNERKTHNQHQQGKEKGL